MVAEENEQVIKVENRKGNLGYNLDEKGGVTEFSPINTFNYTTKLRHYNLENMAGD